MTQDTAVVRVGVLGERNMRWYLGGQLLSLTGTMLQTAVLSLLILEIVGKVGAPFWVGLVWALDLAPGFLFAPFAGILLDRFDKRKVLIVTGIFGVLQAFIFVFLTYTHQITVIEICVLALCMGMVNAVDGPGRNVIIKDAVENQYNVRQASKMFSSLYNLAQILGPGLAGFMILYLGFPITFIINGLSFVALIVALLNMHLPSKVISTEPNQKIKIWALISRGYMYIFSEPGIRLSIILTGLICTFGFLYLPMLSVIARDMFHGNAITFSYFAAASGLGSFFGAFVILKFNDIIPHRTLVICGITLLGASLLTLSFMTYFFAGIVCIFLAGFGFMTSFSSVRSSIIHLARQDLVGIVMGITFTFFYGGMMLGAFSSGFFANLYGCPAVLMTGGIIMLAIGLTVPYLSGIKYID